MGENNLMKYSSTEAVETYKMAKKPLDNFLKEVSKKPAAHLIKKNQFANNAEYLEIGYIEAKLDQIFLGLWSWENVTVQQMINGVQVSGDLKIFHPIACTWLTRNGSAFKEFQLKKGEKDPTPANLSSNALSRDIPIASAEAFKNAAKKLGNVFGRSLNRGFKAEHQADENLMDRIFNDGGEAV
jgi:hypothetical protein